MTTTEEQKNRITVSDSERTLIEQARRLTKAEENLQKARQQVIECAEEVTKERAALLRRLEVKAEE